MYAIMRITGQVGVIGRTLLAAKQPVRAVVRDAGKGRLWADRECEIALANIEDTASLTRTSQCPVFSPRSQDLYASRAAAPVARR
jgi:hypothetical protein